MFCFRKSAGSKFSSLYHPHSQMCIRIYIFCFKQKHTHTHTHTHTQKQKAKEKKETNQERERENMFVVNNFCEKSGYGDIAWQYALCTFNLRGLPTKWESMLKINKLWKAVKAILSVYSIHSMLKWSNFVPWRLLSQHCLKNFFKSRKKFFFEFYGF